MADALSPRRLYGARPPPAGSVVVPSSAQDGTAAGRGGPPRPWCLLRGTLVDIEDPEVGPSTFARTTPHLSAAPEIASEPAPNLGQHTRSVLEGLLGYGPEAVDELIAAGAVAAG